MSKKFIKGNVAFLTEKFELIELLDGQEVPGHLLKYITNTDLLADAPSDASATQEQQSEAQSQGQPEGAAAAAGTATTEPAEKPLSELSQAELKAIAGDLGLPKRGSKEELRNAIETARAAAAEAAAQKSDAEAQSGNSGDASGAADGGEDDEDDDLAGKSREELIAIAEPLGIEVDAENSDDEIVALIEDARG